VADAYQAFLKGWMTNGLDYVRGEAAAENARASVAALMGTDRANVALIASVSAAAGFVAAQLGEATGGESVVIDEQEYSSNHFPWRQLAGKGYEVRHVPFHNGVRSRLSTNSGRTASTTGTQSSRSFFARPSAMRAGRRSPCRRRIRARSSRFPYVIAIPRRS
jgi:hypothetical protein